MSDPQRIAERGDDAFERALLDSARTDAGSEVALERALAAFSAGAGVGRVDGANAAAPSGGLTLAQWVAVGASVAGLAVLGAQLLRPSADQHRDLRARSIATTPQPAASAPPGREPPGSATTTRPESTPPSSVGAATQPQPAEPVARPPLRAAARQTRPQRGAVPDQAARPSTSAVQPATNATTLAAEVRLLEQARAAIGGRDPEQGLAILDRHAREFPAGALEPEAAVLRVEALIAQRQWAQAQLEAGRLLRRHPRGASARRVRELLERVPIP